MEKKKQERPNTYMKQSNLLIFNWRDPRHPLAGGAEQMVFEHAKIWEKQGYSITWFASAFRKGKSEEDIEGIKVIRRGSHYTVFFWAFIFFLRGKFKDINIVVDCFHFLPYFSILYMRRAKKIAIIHEVAGNLWFDNLTFPLAIVGYYLEPHIIRLYKKVTFITGGDSVKKDLVSLGLSSSKINVINHGIRKSGITKFKKEKQPVLIFLGRISKDKGIEDALMTLSLLTRDYKNIMLWIVGKSESKDYEKRVKSLTKEFEVHKNCKWFGYVDEKEKYLLLSKAWILIHPSRKEGWGLNVIEANSVGTPAVGYRVSGLLDSIVDQKTGILVDCESLSMADGVESLLEDKKKLEEMRKQALEWSRKFNWENAGKKSLELISKITKT